MEVENIKKIEKVENYFNVIFKDNSATTVINDINIGFPVEGSEVPRVVKFADWLEENKDTGLFEYVDTIIDRLRDEKQKELKSAYIAAQSCKIINGHTFIIPLLGDFFTKDVKGQVDEATKFGVASLVRKDIYGKVIVLEDLPKELWDYFWQQTKPLSTKNYGIKELLEERISDCNTSEELDSIDILTELPPSTLEIIIDLPTHEEVMEENEITENEVIENIEEENIEEETVEVITEETPPSRQTSDEEEVGEEFSMS